MSIPCPSLDTMWLSLSQYLTWKHKISLTCITSNHISTSFKKINCAWNIYFKKLSWSQKWHVHHFGRRVDSKHLDYRNSHSLIFTYVHTPFYKEYLGQELGWSRCPQEHAGAGHPVLRPLLQTPKPQHDHARSPRSRSGVWRGRGNPCQQSRSTIKYMSLNMIYILFITRFTLKFIKLYILSILCTH